MLEAGPVYEALGLPATRDYRSPEVRLWGTSSGIYSPWDTQACPQNPSRKLVGCVLEERQAWLIKGPCRPLPWATLALSPGRNTLLLLRRDTLSEHGQQKQTCLPPIPIRRPPPPQSSTSSAPTSCTPATALCRSSSRPSARASLTRCAGAGAECGEGRHGKGDSGRQ